MTDNRKPKPPPWAGRKYRYPPWFLWLARLPIQLTQGKDFPGTLTSMRVNTYTAARKRGLRVGIRINESDGTLTIFSRGKVKGPGKPGRPRRDK